MVALTTARPRKLGVSFAILVIGQVIGLAAIGLAAIGLAAHPAHSAPASAPSDRIAVLYNVLTQTMQQAKQLGVNGRFDQLAPVLSQTYDVPSMSRMAVGQSWDTLTPQVQSGIIEAFTRMMVANYASQFDGFSGERFEILQTIDRGPTDKLVKTQLVQGNGKAVELDYLMRSTGGDWKVVDVYLDGSISEIASRRAEFSSILKSGGPEALIASLRKQGDKLLARSS
jgi:phospholipid transport system substrate-binding protein